MAEKKSWRDYSKDNKTEESTTSEKSTGGWRDYSTVDTGSIVANNVKNRVNSWLNNHNSYISDYQNRYSSRKGGYEDDYVGDSAEWLDTISKQYETYRQDAKDILAYVDQYKDYLDAEWVNNVRNTLISGSQQQRSLVTGATKDNEYWSSWGSDDLIAEYGSAQDAYKAHQLLNANTGKSTQELDEILAGMEDGGAKSLLSSYRATVDYDEKSKYDIAAAEKELARMEAEAEELATVSTKFSWLRVDDEGNWVSNNFSPEEMAEILDKYAYYRVKYDIENPGAALQEAIKQKKQYLEQAKRVQDGIKMVSVADASSENYDPEFSQYAEYIDDGDTPLIPDYKDIVYDFVNKNGDSSKKAMAQAWSKLSNEESSRLNAIKYMTEDEVALYNYYYNKQGYEAAEKYLDGIIENLNAKHGQAVFDSMNGNHLVELLYSPIAGLDQFESGLKSLFSNEDYIPTTSTQFTSSLVREDLKDVDLKWYDFSTGEWKNQTILDNSLGQSMYDLSTTTFNMAPSILVSSLVGALNPVAGTVVGNTLMGASAAGNAYQEVLNQGYGKEEARAYSTAVGVSEALLQYALGGISKLGGVSSKISKAVAGIDSGLLRFSLQYGGKMLSEGLEEGLQEILTPIFKNAILGTDEDINWSEVAYSALLGGLSAGLLEGKATVNEVRSETALNKTAVNQYGDFTGDLIKEGLESDVNSESYQLATKYKQKTEGTDTKKGKALNGYEIRQLVDANEAQFKVENYNDALPKAKEMLKSLGQTENVDTIANLAAKYASGQDLTRSEKSTLTRSQYGAQVAKELKELSSNAEQKQSEAKTTNTSTYKPIDERAREAKALTASNGGQTTTQEGKVLATQQETAKAATGKEYLQVGKESVTVTEKIAEAPATEEAKTVTLEDASQKYGAQAKAMIHTYQAGQDVAKYDKAYQIAYDMGNSGVSYDYVKNSQAISYLTDTQKQLAYEAGKSSSHTAAMELDTKNKAAANGKTGRKEGAVRGEGVTISDLKKTFNDTQGKAYKYLSTVAKVTGIDIVLYRSQSNAYGKYVDAQGRYRRSEPGTIYIDLNAGLSDIKSADDLAKYAMLRTFAHEFTHFVENWNPIQYNEFRKVVFDTLTQRGENVHDLIEEKQARNPGMSYDKASREIVAEAMTDVLPDANFVQDLAENHKTIFQKLLDQLKEFVANLRDYFNSIGHNQSREANALKEQVGDTIKYLDNIVKLFDNVAAQAVENYQKTVATEETVNEVKYDSGDAALLAYKSGGSYLLNTKLREGLELSKQEQAIVDGLDKVLEKLPIHKGKVYRNVIFDGFGDQEARDAFVAGYSVEEPVRHEAYTSSSTRTDGYVLEGDYVVHMEIESVNGRDVDGYGNNFESEVLFPRKSYFETDRIEYADDGTPTIYLTEVPYGQQGIQDASTGNLGREQRPSAQTETDKVRKMQKTESQNPDMQPVSGRDTESNRGGTGKLSEVRREVKPEQSDFEKAFWNATQEERDEVVEAINRNTKITHIAPTEIREGVYAEKSEEVKDRGESENGTDTQAVHEPVRGSERPARLLEGMEPGSVQGSNEGRQSVQPGDEQGTADAGRNGQADATGAVSTRSARNRVGGDLQQLPGTGTGADRSGAGLSGTVQEERNDHDRGRTGRLDGELRRTDRVSQEEQSARDYASEKGYGIKINSLSSKKGVTQVDIYDKDGLPTSQYVIINDQSDWNKVKETIDKHEAWKKEQAEKLKKTVADQIEQQSTEQPKGRNFVIGDSLNLPSGTKARVRANIEAIKLVKQIAAEDRIATPAEHEILSKYVGWGGLADAFGKPVTNYTTRKLEYEAVNGLEAEFEELKTVLTEEEYKSARESTKNAHYTSIEVIKAMYDGLKQLGFTGGRMLEPSSGVGNFVGAMPADMTAQVKSWTMVELDNITGLFAKYLYPNADVRIQGFEETNIPDGYMDVAIGNVPFGNYAITDKHYPKAVTSAIHNYFFAKSLDKVRTGGIVMFITSAYTMNGRDSAVRKYIMQRADLLGAIRLPNTAFAGNAGTSVVTDVLILKKRAERTEYAGEAFEASNWERVSNTGWDGAYVNEYFIKHPEMVLGTPKMTRGMYSSNELTYDPFTDRGSLGDQIRDAMKNIQGKMEYPAQLSPEKENYRQASAKKKQQKLIVKDGEIHAKDESGNVVKVELDNDTSSRIVGMVAIRDAHVALCDALQQGVKSQEITKLRKALNQAYDSFVEKYGYLNAQKNKKAINTFTDRYAIQSLENYSTEGKKVTVTKSDIFHKNTIAANRTASSAENVDEGLTISLNTLGYVDVGMIARLTGQTADSVTRQMIDQRLVFKDKDGNLIPAAQYLSGNVRAKLREMEGLVGIDSDYRNNVEALREVVPPTIQYTDIYVNPGANWVPVSVYENFVGYILKRNNYESYRTGKKDFSVEYVPETNEYKVSVNDAYAKMSAQNTQVWGESGKSFSTIFENMLNGRRTNVYKDNGDGTRILDKAKTEAVAEKVEKLNEEFRKWLWDDESRRAEMQELYNEAYNALVTPKYSGANLTVNGLNSTYELREHQKDAVARIINSGGNTLLAHRVGAGKTMEMAAAAMKLKQLGVIKKPMFVVPNNVVAQWGKEFKDYFPAANILVVGDEDMSPAERMTTINRIKNNDYDAVILAYTKFEKIQMTTEWRRKFYEEQIESIMFAINAEKESQGGKGFTVKQLETKRKQLEARLKKLTDKAKDDDGAMFEDLGVDSLFVDEAHNFKNLEYSTRMNNVSGLGKADGSQRAFDLYTKVRYLQQMNGGRGVVFATATPVMNSMTEMYIMQKYLQPDTLKQLGIEHFDSWAKMFGEVVNALEIAPSGSGYRLKQTFSRFKNVKALQQLFRSFTDVLTDVPGLKIPKMKGGKVQIVQCEQGEFQKNYMEELAKRAENVKSVDPSEDNMLKITSDGRKISYSQRMIDPSLPYEETGKIYKCCENVYAVYLESNKTKGTQMIFCDMATPKGKSTAKADADTNTDEFAAVDVESAQLYDDIKARLVQLGIPAKEITFIHDAKNDKQKAELSEKMNNGTIRVLLGSTGKMGVGLNAQKKAVAIHHLDAPWRPGDIEQRDGRVFRQKNENEEAYKFVYVTKGSFDSRLWDILERKQKFINQVMNGEDVGNEIEDTGEVTLSAAEVKAVASDNPLIMEQVALEKEISKLQSLQQAHMANVSRAEEMIVNDRRNIANLENLISNLQKDIKSRVDTYSSDKVFSIQIGGQTFTDKKDAGAALVAAAQAHATEGSYTAIGKFAGFTLRVVKTLEGVKGVVAGTGNYEFKTYPMAPTQGINHLIAVVEGFEERLTRLNKNLTETKSDIETQKQLAAQPFEYAENLKQKRARYNEVMYILNPPADQAVSDDVQEQNQERTSTLTDREVLEKAADEVRTSDWTDAEKSALDIFQKRLSKLKDLQEERAKHGRLYKEQQFGAKVDREAAAKTLNRMHILDDQIKAASADVLSVEDKQVLKRVLQKARKVVEQQEREHGQEILDRWRDRRNNADAIKKYRERLTKDVNDLTDWVLHPNNKDVVKHIPDVLKNSVIPFLSSIDFTSKQQLRGGDATKADKEFMKRLNGLKSALKPNQSAEGLYADYSDLPPNFMDRLQTLIDAAQAIVDKNSGEFVVNQMTSEELRELSQVVRTLKTYIEQFNRFHVNAMFQHVSEAGDNSISELNQMGNASDKTGTVSNFVFWQQIRPAYAWERFGEGGKAIYDGLRRGQAKLAFNTKTIQEFAETAYTEAEVKAWEKEIKLINLGGDIVKMPVSTIMSFYELSKRPQALGHILGNGVRVATFKNGKEKISDTGHILSMGDVQTIIDTLTDRQKEVADNLQKFMQQQGGKWGNYVSVKRFGEELFGEEHYFPINSDGRHLAANADEHPGAASLYALLNMGFTKSTTEGANNRLVLYSIFDVFANHMASMAQYNAFALPVVDAIKWFNYQQKSEPDENGKRLVVGSVRDQMDRVYGVPEETKPGSGRQGYAQTFVINILKAFNGTEAQGVPSDAAGMNALRRYNMAQVAYNLRVVAQQPLAITRAALLVDYGSIIKGMKLKPSAIQQNIQEMQRYSGIAAWKGLGFYDVNISRGLTDIIKHKATVLDKVNKVGMWGAEQADLMTWAGIWSACKEEVMKKQHLTPKSEGFYDAVTKLFEDVIYKTQVVDSVLTKNQYMRSKGFWTRAMSSFMSEPTTTASMLIDAYDKYHTDIQKGMSRQQAWKKNGKMIVRTVYVYGASATLLAAVQAVADAMRDDDDEQEWYEKWLEAFGGNLFDEIVPVNKLPILNNFYELGKELLSIFGVDTYGNAPTSVFMQWYDSLIKGTEILWDKISGKDTNYTWYGGAYKLLQAASGMSGLPMAAATREIVTAWNNIVGAMAPSLKVKIYDPGKKNDIKYAYQDGYLTAEEAAEKLLQQGLVDNEDEAYWTIQSWDAGEGYSRYDAIYDAARNGGDFNAAMKELTSHGYTEKDVLSQVKSKIGEWYKTGETTKQQTINMLTCYTDMTSDEITETVNKWSCKVVTGIAFEDIKEKYMSGNITGSRAIEMYVRYGGYTKEDATEKVGYWGFYKENPKYDYFSESNIDKYREFAEPANISLEVFAQYVEGTKGLATIYDKWGDVEKDVRDQTLEVIHALPLTRKQKDALYLAAGYAESKIWDVPW